MECTGNALGRAKKCSTTQPPPGCDGVKLTLSRTRKRNMMMMIIIIIIIMKVEEKEIDGC